MTYTPSDDVDIKVGGMSFRVRNVIPLPNRSTYLPTGRFERFNIDVHLLMEGETVYSWDENVYLYNTDEFTSDDDYEHAIRLEIRSSIGRRIEKLIKTVLNLQRIND